MTETVSVFGADRQQGNAVATALLEDGGFTVRAVVQKLTFPSAQLLQAGGAHIMLADIDDPASTDCALSGADKCVAITHTNLNTRDPLQVAIPMGEVAMDGMSIKQIGRIMTALLKNPERWIKKSCFLSAGRLTIQEYAQILTHHLHPKRFKDSQISVQEFVKSFGGPGAEDLGNMFEFCKRGGQKMNISMSFKLYPELQTFQQWVSANTTSLDS